MNKIRLLLKQIMGYIPELLPVGKTEMHKFMDDIIEISGQFADRDSMKFVLANMIQGLGNNTARVSKQYFANAMRKVAANQVAGDIFRDIKLAQEELKKLKAEVTAPTSGNNSGESKNSTAAN